MLATIAIVLAPGAAPAPAPAPPAPITQPNIATASLRFIRAIVISSPASAHSPTRADYHELSRIRQTPSPPQPLPSPGVRSPRGRLAPRRVLGYRRMARRCRGYFDKGETGMNANVGTADRVIRFPVGAALLAFFFSARGALIGRD